MIAHAALQPESVFIELALKKCSAHPNRFVNKSGFAQNPADDRVAFIDARCRIAVIFFVKPILAYRPMEEILFHARFHILP